MKIQLLNTENLKELRDLIAVFEKVFEMKNFTCLDKDQLEHLLNKNSFIAVTAQLNDKVVGGLTAYVLEQYYTSKSLAYIFDLAVLEEYQRRGIGKQLMEFINNYCKEKGFEEVFVQADKVDDHAIDFYRSIQATHEEEVVHFTYKLDSNNRKI